MTTCGAQSPTDLSSALHAKLECNLSCTFAVHFPSGRSRPGRVMSQSPTHEFELQYDQLPSVLIIIYESVQIYQLKFMNQ